MSMRKESIMGGAERVIWFSIFLLATSRVTPAGAVPTMPPVTPHASPEAVKLLDYLYSISGEHTLTGQHSVPLLGSLRLASVEKQTGKYPAVFGQDFGFSAPGTWDGINFRQQLVDEAIRRSSEGFIITLMWHAVPPTQDEPVDFRKSIQSELTDDQWKELITPGTNLNERWKSQVDVIAWHLKQLQGAGVPVLWRPYHEMNGDWFWWGKKPGDDGYRKLWRMLYDRLVNFHKLNNLIWVFNGNETRENVDPYAEYFPGRDFVDVLATDIYGTGFAKDQYDELLALAGDKPIAIGECGQVPTPQILDQQPRWTWFMLWGEPGRGGGGGGDRRQPNPFREVYGCAQALTHDELPWVTVKQPTIHYPVLK
jgi:mannan endo-1,4-beta-mannosidase